MTNQPRTGNSLRRILAVTVLVALAMIGLAGPARADQSPTDVVRGLVNPALKILADKSLSRQDRADKLKQLVSADVFDFAAMARSGLGIHWRDINDQQRQDFTQVFTAFLRDSYISRIQDASAQPVNFQGETDLGDGRTEVKTTIQQTAGDTPLQVNYLLRNDGGKLLVYDVTVDNISIAANYRNQFNRVINNQGFDALMADLKRKQQGLEEQLGSPHASD